MKNKTSSAIASFLALLAGASQLHAQGTAFTYQGRLTDGMGPANGCYDFQFALYDADLEGMAQADKLTLEAAAVSNGLFTVLLDFGNGVFTGDGRWLEIGVRTNGAGAFVTLAPRQAMTPAPYAIYAAQAGHAALATRAVSVPDGSITSAQLAPGAVSAANMAAGSITANQLAPGAAAANLTAAGQSGVASGGLVLSATENAALLGAGYVRIGTTTTADNWEQRGNGAPAPGARYNHTAVWTGSEMIVWGGNNGGFLNDGGRYNPAANCWSAVSGTGAPAARQSHTAVWSGSEMIIWGGISNATYSAAGGRYNPAGNCWAAVSTNGMPAARRNHTAVWTGSEMVIWGGHNGSYLNTGGRYNPAANSWAAVATAGAPAARGSHTAAWTGSEMIVWGGTGGSPLNTGGRYSPAANSWTAVTTSGAPAARRYHTAVWSGVELIVWGGSSGSAFNDGGRYNPVANSWTPMTTTGAPAARYYHTAAWSGSELIVWGGVGLTDLSDGGRYDPAGDCWTTVSTNAAPAARYFHTAVWTGGEMIIWGGTGSSILTDGGRYSPAANRWTPMTSNAAPAGRSQHTAVWTGSEMIVWGGYFRTGSNSTYYSTGGRYNPVANSWVPMSTNSAPAGRFYYTAVWTGSEMIVWGGYNDGTGNTVNTGGRYNPASDSWTAVSTNGAPSARAAHTAVWSGNEMIVWGGYSWAGTTDTFFSDGKRYNPAGDSWTAVSTNGAPATRASHTAVWTGSEMIVWGGNNEGFLNDGGRYNPAGNNWTAVSTSNGPGWHTAHTAVWTGDEMIVWGGTGFSNELNTGGRYNPGSNSWMPVSTTDAPTVRQHHVAVWTGSEMIVWGGFKTSGPTNVFWSTGGRYNPADNRWTTSVTTPSGREYHTAVWTGSEMIVWGGDYGSYGKSFNETWSYTPGKVMYLYQRP